MVNKTEEGINKGLKFQVTRNRIRNDYLKRGKEDFAAAIKEWKEYLSNSKVKSTDRRKADQEMERQIQSLGGKEAFEKMSDAEKKAKTKEQVVLNTYWEKTCLIKRNQTVFWNSKILAVP